MVFEAVGFMKIFRAKVTDRWFRLGVKGGEAGLTAVGILLDIFRDLCNREFLRSLIECFNSIFLCLCLLFKP